MCRYCTCKSLAWAVLSGSQVNKMGPALSHVFEVGCDVDGGNERFPTLLQGAGHSCSFTNLFLLIFMSSWYIFQYGLTHVLDYEV